MKQWLISDTHFGHKNIVKHCKRPENHNELMIENWQKLVAPEDTIFHLGDVFMGPGSKEYAAKIIPDLPGFKMLILGNHDTEPISFYESLGFEINTQPQIWGKSQKTYVTHYPLCRDYPKWDINIHGHIHNTGYAPGTPQKRFYRNVSVEVTGYAPVLLEDVITGKAGASRKEGGDWPLSLVVEMRAKGRLDKNLCEIDRCPQVC